MTATRLRQRLAALREVGAALRSRPYEETLETLGRVLDGWSDAASPWRAELERELPVATGFSPEVVREGLQLALEDWNAAALRELVRRELGSGEPAAPEAAVTAVFLAGSIPMPSLLSLLAPLATRSPVLAKCASRDAVTAPLVARSVRETDPGLGACLEVVHFRGDDDEAVAALCEADCVVATGSDETVARIRERVSPPRQVVCHGHRLSAAAVGPDACSGSRLEETAAALALDVALWDQLGCLSPVCVYAAGERGADAVAEALAHALQAVEQELPRGSVDPGAAALATGEREAATLRAAAGQPVRVHAGSTWTVVREADTRVRPFPLHRFVRVHPIADGAQLPRALQPLARHLAGVALAGFGAATEPLARGLARLGASRVCAPGRLQAPPLAWPRDGLGVLRPCARPATLELPPAGSITVQE